MSLGEVSTTWYILNLNLNLCCISVIFRGWRCYFNVGSGKTLIFSPTEITLVRYAIHVCTCTYTGSNPFYIKEIMISPRIFKTILYRSGVRESSSQTSYPSYRCTYMFQLYDLQSLCSIASWEFNCSSSWLCQKFPEKSCSLFYFLRKPFFFTWKTLHF